MLTVFVTCNVIFSVYIFACELSNLATNALNPSAHTTRIISTSFPMPTSENYGIYDNNDGRWKCVDDFMSTSNK